MAIVHKHLRFGMCLTTNPVLLKANHNKSASSFQSTCITYQAAPYSLNPDSTETTRVLISNSIHWNHKQFKTNYEAVTTIV